MTQTSDEDELFSERRTKLAEIRFYEQISGKMGLKPILFPYFPHVGHQSDWLDSPWEKSSFPLPSNLGLTHVQKRSCLDKSYVIISRLSRQEFL